MKHCIPLLLALAGFVSLVHAGGQGYGAAPGSSYDSTQADYKMVWRGFNMNTESLLKTIGATDAEAATLLRQIQTNAAFLEQRWNVWYQSHAQQVRHLGDQYVGGLRADVRLLTDAKKEKDGAKALDMLRDAALDLQIKADNCRHSKDGLGKDIKVKVHTKAGEKEVGGYQVYYVPKGLLDRKSAHERFPRQSSPTDEQILSPGSYAMWVRKKDFASEPIMQRIGGRGEASFEIDIPVPAE